MRIRKNARLITSSSSSTSSFLICQLNRSPWDVDSFSLQSEHEDEFGVSGGNNLAQVIPSSDSLPSVESMMELSFEYVEKTAAAAPPPPPQRMPPLENDFEERVKVREDEQIGGCRTNINNHNNGWKNIHPPLPPVPAVPKKRGRPKKSASIATTASNTTTTTVAVTTTNHNSSSSNNNPYEFYYYSGFGPSWSKKRGNKYTTTSSNGNNVSNCCNGLTMNDVDESPSSSASHVMGEDDRDDDDKRNSNSVIVMDRVVEGELDYIEDDFDDDDDEEDENGGCGRRIRKPIKARSLKSLM